MKPVITFIVFIALGVCVSATVGVSAPVDPIVTEAVVNASVAEVWKIWTTKEGIESWMVAKTDIDLTVGGTWRASYSKTSNLDDDESLRHIILAFDPLKMFAMRTVKPPKNFPFPNAILKTWTVVYFEPVGERQTKVTSRMMGFADDEESQKMRRFFEVGNKSTLDSLVKKYQSN